MEGGLWAPGGCLSEGELLCPCVKEEEAGNSALAPPLLQAAENDPGQGTKGTVQGWVCSQCEGTHGILRAPHWGKTALATQGLPWSMELVLLLHFLKIEPA